MEAENALPKLHDAELVSVAVDRKTWVVTADVRLPNGDLCRLTFCGIRGFRVVDLISQNVVSRALLSSTNAFSSDEIAHWVTWTNSLLDTESFVSEDNVGKYVSKIKTGSLSLLVLEPSWGATFAVIYESLEVSAL